MEGDSQGLWSADCMMVRRGGITGADIISPWAPGGLGLYVHGHQVVKFVHLVLQFSHL